MNRYEVIDLSRDGARASLRDGTGRLHVVQLQGPLLQRGDRVTGRIAMLGAQLLLPARRHVLLHVRFESVGCTQDEALARLHPVNAAKTTKDDAAKHEAAKHEA